MVRVLMNFVVPRIRLFSLAGIILCMRPANERRRYTVTSSLIDWVHTRGAYKKRSLHFGLLDYTTDFFLVPMN